MFSAKDLFFASQGGYRISNSLRFRSSASAYLNRTPSASNQTTWTWSAWVKRGSLGLSQVLLSANRASASEGTAISFTSSDTLQHYAWNGSAFVYNYITTQVFRDPSSWYHFVVVLDTSNGTSTDRVRLYINGVRVTAFGTSTAPSTSATGYVNAAQIHAMGRSEYNSSFYFDGYMAEVNFIDGQALDASAFGQTDTATGVWIPKAYTGTYGTNGFYLKFDEVGATTTTNTGYGKDSSGNANRWTTNNFGTTSTATTYDSMVDTPTNFDNGGNGAGNYCVLSPIDKDTARGTLVNANLRLEYTAFSSFNAAAVRGTMGVNTGKWYFEHINITRSGSGNSSGFVLANYLTSLTGNSIFGNNITNAIGLRASVFNNNITFYTNGLSASLADGTTLFSAYVSGDVVNIAIDIPNGKIWIGRNGTWYNSGNPAAGTNATSTFTAPSGLMFPIVDAATSGDNANQSTANPNFGQRPFANTPPSGFLALNTQNLTTPTIINGAQYMDAVLYSGNAPSSRTITGELFSPDFVWIKGRSGATDHALYDTVRGVQLQLESNNTGAETTESTGLTTFTADGFTVGSLAQVNTNAATYVAWLWDAASSNTTIPVNAYGSTPSIASTVRANTTAGFSVVTFVNPTGTTQGTVGHGLGATPRLIIAKDRTTAGNLWVVFHASVCDTTSKYLSLNGTGSVATFSTIWGANLPTSSVFGITAGGIGAASANMVAYCFAEVAGYSAFGSYTGNGSTDGPFVYLGFRPRWIMIKNSSTAATDWFIVDSSINTYNVVSNLLIPNTNGTEVSALTICDFLSSGFKLRDTNSSRNASGSTYIYAAFAENPFKISRAR